MATPFRRWATCRARKEKTNSTLALAQASEPRVSLLSFPSRPIHGIGLLTMCDASSTFVDFGRRVITNPGLAVPARVLYSNRTTCSNKYDFF